MPGSGNRESIDGVADVDEQTERDGTDSRGRGILLVIRAELAVQTEVGLTKGVVPWVWGPHAGEDLGHGAKVLLHGPLAYGLAIGGKVTGSDSVGKHLEERDRVVDASEGRIESQLSAEEGPLAPVGLVGGGPTGMDSSGNLVLAKAVDSPCCCAGVR